MWIIEVGSGVRYLVVDGDGWRQTASAEEATTFASRPEAAEYASRNVAREVYVVLRKRSDVLASSGSSV